MFEFNPAKSAINLAKHGIDFEQAKALWSDDDAYRIPSAQTQHGEERGLLIARHGGRAWVAIFTLRDTVIRIISVRRARDYEEVTYDQARADRARSASA